MAGLHDEGGWGQPHPPADPWASRALRDWIVGRCSAGMLLSLAGIALLLAAIVLSAV